MGLPVAGDIVQTVKDLELGTPEGVINLVTLGFISGAAVLPAIFRAGGALVDRIILLVLLLKSKPLPRGFKPSAFVEARQTLHEGALLIVMAALCLIALGVTH